MERFNWTDCVLCDVCGVVCLNGEFQDFMVNALGVNGTFS